jgi:hypothetical protein
VKKAMSRANAVRCAVAAVAVASVIVAATAGIERNSKGELPHEALGSVLLLRIEHGVIVFAVLLFALVVLAKGLAEGTLPTKIGRETVEYAQTADRAERATETLAKLSDRRWGILRQVTLSQQERLEKLEERISQLER